MIAHYFHPVPGSARLRTSATASDQALERIENLPAGLFERQLVGGEALGRAVVRDAFVPVLRDVFDRLAPLQSPIEQVLYLHLYRHSYGEDRNHCRLARRELGLATGLSPRRFNRALAGLVRKGHVKLLQRDRRGTLYRVLLPGEVLSGRVGSEVLLGRLAKGPALVTEQGTEPTRRQASRRGSRSARRSGGDTGKTSVRGRVAPSPGRTLGPNRHHKMISIDRHSDQPAEPGALAPSPPPSVGQLVEAVLSRLPPKRRSQASQDVLQDVLELLEEGFSAQQLIEKTKVFSVTGRGAAEFARAVRRVAGDET